MVVAGILLIVLPFLAFIGALGWAGSKGRRGDVQGPTLAFKLITVYFVIGGLCDALALGFFARSIAPALTAVGFGGVALALAVVMMGDGRLLARARPLDRWEVLSLRWLLGVSAVLGLAILVDVPASHHHPASALLAAGLAVAVGCGAVAAIAMLRG
jgi:hypothetical protein